MLFRYKTPFLYVLNIKFICVLSTWHSVYFEGFLNMPKDVFIEQKI